MSARHVNHDLDVRDHDAREEPEFGNSRRRFLIAMLMLNAIPPQRVVERIVADIEDDELLEIET